jgi:hypothetical protein
MKARFRRGLFVTLAALITLSMGAGCRIRIPRFSAPRVPAVPKVQMPRIPQVEMPRIQALPGVRAPGVRGPLEMPPGFGRGPFGPRFGLRPEFELNPLGGAARAERPGLVRGLEQMEALGREGQWGRAKALAEEQLRGGSQLPGETRKALDDVVSLGKQSESLDRVQSGLEAVEQNRPAEAAREFDRVRPEDLPASLQKPVYGLRGLEELRVTANQPWRQPPDMRQSKRLVGDLRAGGGDTALAGRVQQDLAVRAFLEGHPAEARALLPGNGPPEHAARLLRDLKTVALGKGEVGTWPARGALGVKPGEVAGPAQMPPGLRPLVPEGTAQGWRPGVRESARADLPPLEEAARLEKPLRDQAAAGLKAQREAVNLRGASALNAVRGLSQRRPDNKAEDEDFKKRLPGNGVPLKTVLAKVEAQLGRKLSVLERTLAEQLARQGMKAAEITAVLGAKPR